MTTARSPKREIRVQAQTIAVALKAALHGKTIADDPAGKISAALKKESITFGVVMDDKILKIKMPWVKIRDTSLAGIAEYIFNQMREARPTLQ